jgi:hypothetical protein
MLEKEGSVTYLHSPGVNRSASSACMNGKGHTPQRGWQRRIKPHCSSSDLTLREVAGTLLLSNWKGGDGL